MLTSTSAVCATGSMRRQGALVAAQAARGAFSAGCHGISACVRPAKTSVAGRSRTIMCKQSQSQQGVARSTIQHFIPSNTRPVTTLCPLRPHAIAFSSPLTRLSNTIVRLPDAVASCNPWFRSHDNALLCRASYSSSSAPGENDEAKPKTPVAPAAAQQELHPSSPPSPSERAPSPPQSSSSADEQDVEQLLKSQLPSELGWLSGAGGAATSAARGQRKDAAQQGLGEQRAPADPAAAAEGGDVAARLGEGASGRAAAVQAAVKEGTLGFGFSAGGFLYCYHLGVLWELQRLGLLRDRVQMAGASAGSLAIATYNSGLDVTKATSALHEFAAECRSHGTRYRLSGLLKDFLHTYLPDDAHLRCEGVCHVALTRLFPYLQPESVSQFHSKDDLVEALLASCHIPVYASGSWVTKFRGRYYVDGGVANFVPAPPTPTAIKVCCFPVNQILNRVQPTVQNSARLSALLDVSISPDAFEAFPHSYQTMLTWALLPAEPEVLDSLITKGRRDALAWAQSMQLVEGQGLLQPATSTTLS